ncbi:MAG TPA: hypothetical protein VE130_17410, partial [Nitrososphaeraceae archaeon]|nr:hypothetical protein [Nitrososphaeraceae archaeon]
MSSNKQSQQEYNPFRMMVEFKIFKEFTVPIAPKPFGPSFLHKLEKLEITEEFSQFAQAHHYTTHRGPLDNIYTFDCTYEYLKDKDKYGI